MKNFEWKSNRLSYAKCKSRGGIIGMRPELTGGGGGGWGWWWWWGGGGGGGWIKWLGVWGWLMDGGGGPCQTPPAPGESTRPAWNPLGSTFDLNYIYWLMSFAWVGFSKKTNRFRFLATRRSNT